MIFRSFDLSLSTLSYKQLAQQEQNGCSDVYTEPILSTRSLAVESSL